MRDAVVTRVRWDRTRRRTRTLEERVVVRFPWLFRRTAAVLFDALTPRSRLRRALLRWAVVSGWGSFERRDFELNAVFFASDVEYEGPREMQGFDLAGSFRGIDQRFEVLDKLLEIWGSEFEPVYTLDMGDRVLNLGLWHTTARGSGIPLTPEFAQLVTLRRGLIARERNFFGWETGLRAAGLEPSDLALPR